MNSPDTNNGKIKSKGLFSSANAMVFAYIFSMAFIVIAIAISYTILKRTISTQTALTQLHSQVHDLQLSISDSVGALSDYRTEVGKSNPSPRVRNLISRRVSASVKKLDELQQGVIATSSTLKKNSVWAEVHWITDTEESSLNSKLDNYIGQMKASVIAADAGEYVAGIPVDAAGARYGSLFLGYEKASGLLQKLIADSSSEVNMVHKMLTAFIIITMLLISALVVAPLWMRLASGHRRLESAHQKLYKIAYLDRETGLPNLDGLERQLPELISFKDKEPYFYLLLVKIRNLDQITNLIGSQSIGALLQALSVRLQNFDTRQHQWSRSGEAEFTCLVRQGKVEHAHQWAESLYRVITERLVIEGVIVRADISMSVSRIKKSEMLHANLLWEHQSNARLASVNFEPQDQWLPQYHTDMNNKLIDQNNLIEQISKGLTKQQFVPFYQIKVAANTGLPCSIEVLARWIRSDNSMESPGVFIPAAESSGLIVPMTFSIFDQVLADIQEWCAQGIPVGRVAINVARDVLLHPELLRRLQQMLDKLPDLCEGLEIEVTENIAIGENTERTFAILSGIRDMGIHVAIDDFGTGYASLQTLIDLPFDVLKIDRAFVIPMTETGVGNEVVTAMISLCNTMGKTCVIEGVETDWQWRLLAEMGADVLQGFYFHKPANAATTHATLCNDNDWLSAA